MQPASTTRIQMVIEEVHQRWGSTALVRGNEAVDGRALMLPIVDEHCSIAEQLAPLKSYLRRGQIVELSGGPSSGKTALAQALIGVLTGTTGLGAIVDSAATFYPPSAAALGLKLDRLWIVHPPDWNATLNAVELLLRSGVLQAVLWDLVGHHPGLTNGQIQRLRAAAAQGETTLLLLTSRTAPYRSRTLDFGATTRLVVQRRALLFEHLGRQQLLTGFQIELEIARAPGNPLDHWLELTLGSGTPQQPARAQHRL
jgi:energy-coupling factor transporter ATP-binding protein EcfA2